ncbi:protein of unknown function DUF6 transmembrane [Pirellula staleyi DSM 6068]|uniref:EamA domain-containing protein n=1 Tax=Pirellula staleyi (strain ATCC 27377 / DSM 6068 / ICPB 4128) TaxID=530564 RepID=D2R0B0_PIRSD|nr:DMT family transporter [Pirellula staleyi]ADB14778.1 protein of unknown function DUF6 transmembrane [Pirellula staleyi DSM 6068]
MNFPPTVDDRTLARARMMAFVAAVLWSTSGFFAKTAYLADWAPERLCFWRAVFATLILLPLVRAPKFSWLLLPLGISFSLMTTTFLTAMKWGTAANAIWLQCTGPVWMLLVGVLFLGERLRRADVLQMCFAGAGIAVILWFEAQGESLAAVAIALSSGVCYAVVVLILRQLRDFDGTWLIAVCHLTNAIVLAPFALWNQPLPEGMQWPLLIAFGMLQLGLSYVLFARSLRSIPGHEAALIALVEPILVPVWGYLTDGNAPAWWTIVGAALILVGLATTVLRSKPIPPTKVPMAAEVPLASSDKPL